MSWEYEFTEEAKKDIKNLDGSIRPMVLAGIDKVSENPLPGNEGGYGTPLGNMNGNNLTGLLKIKFKKAGIRVVYSLIRTDKKMKIIVISVRADNEVYDIAAKRIKRI